VRFVVDKVALGQVFLRVVRFTLSVSFHWDFIPIYHLGNEYRPVGGQRSETYSHPMVMKIHMGIIQQIIGPYYGYIKQLSNETMYHNTNCVFVKQNTTNIKHT
jgi:hypothetical protein